MGSNVMSTPDETKPWFMKIGGTPQIVIIWYLNGNLASGYD